MRTVAIILGGLFLLGLSVVGSRWIGTAPHALATIFLVIFLIPAGSALFIAWKFS